MAFLEQFADQDRAMIVSLPYRVGLWVSTVDETGGRKAAVREMETLRAIIDSRMVGMFSSAFVHEVMTEIMAHAHQWPDWADDAENALRDCVKVLDLLSARLSARDVDAYRENIMRIGVEVASAFREFDLKAPLCSRLWAKVRLSIDKLVGALRRETYESERLLSISYEEDLALSQLAVALKLPGHAQAEAAAL